MVKKKKPWKVKLQTPSSKRKRALRRERKGGIIVDYIYYGILIKEPIKITESVWAADRLGHENFSMYNVCYQWVIQNKGSI